MSVTQVYKTVNLSVDSHDAIAFALAARVSQCDSLLEQQGFGGTRDYWLSEKAHAQRALDDLRKTPWTIA